ncbi:leucine-rich repeat protein [Cloacibacterium sp.]|uniref:leucine-rich repeat domain-containing protein n=1 Tax=Cloacibacterium sp. TaxID=1913682 RepID=UPI0035AEA33B
MKTKLLFSIALLFCFVKSLIAQTTFTVDNINYEVTSSRRPFTVKITGLVDRGVSSVTIPLTVTNNSKTYNVTAIGNGAFGYCGNLTSVSISDSVTSIGDYAFYNCSNLPSISIPDSVTSIGFGAFYYCISLTSVSIGNSVTSIGDWAFRDCKKLTSVSIGNSVTSIGAEAFASCINLTSVSIGNSVTSIGQGAFHNCYKLTSVSIGNSVTSIGYEAFKSCYELTSFTCLATTPPTLNYPNTFIGGWQSNCDLYVPESALSAYRNADQWKYFRSVKTYTYLSTTETKNNLLKVYPNPAKDHVVISNISKGENISVYDLSGKILFQTKSPGNSLNINTSSYKNGIYLVKVGEKTTKIIVNK